MELQQKFKQNIIKKFIIILCTVPHNENIALSLAKTLITNNLAVCVTLLHNAHSIFSWNNKIKEQKEIQLLIKTHVNLEKSVFKHIKTSHPYQTPELLTLKIINGELHYLSWVHDTLNNKNKQNSLSPTNE